MKYRNMEFVASQIDALVYELSGAHCEFRVMDKAYLKQLEFPEITVDSSGTPLRDRQAVRSEYLAADRRRGGAGPAAHGLRPGASAFLRGCRH